MKRQNFKGRKERRKKSAIARQAAYSTLSFEEKMKRAGSRERMKLASEEMPKGDE